MFLTLVALNNDKANFTTLHKDEKPEFAGFDESDNGNGSFI